LRLALLEVAGAILLSRAMSSQLLGISADQESQAILNSTARSSAAVPGNEHDDDLLAKANRSSNFSKAKPICRPAGVRNADMTGESFDTSTARQLPLGEYPRGRPFLSTSFSSISRFGFSFDRLRLDHVLAHHCQCSKVLVAAASGNSLISLLARFSTRQHQIAAT